MHVPRGFQRGLPAGREEEGGCHWTGHFPGGVKPAGKHFTRSPLHFLNPFVLVLNSQDICTAVESLYNILCNACHCSTRMPSSPTSLGCSRGFLKLTGLKTAQHARAEVKILLSFGNVMTSKIPYNVLSCNCQLCCVLQCRRHCVLRSPLAPFAMR